MMWFAIGWFSAFFALYLLCLFNCKKHRLVFAWYDGWVGYFIDQQKHRIYLFPLPMIGFRFDFKVGYTEQEKNDELVAQDQAREQLLKGSRKLRTLEDLSKEQFQKRMEREDRKR